MLLSAGGVEDEDDALSSYHAGKSPKNETETLTDATQKIDCRRHLERSQIGRGGNVETGKRFLSKKKRFPPFLLLCNG